VRWRRCGDSVLSRTESVLRRLDLLDDPYVIIYQANIVAVVVGERELVT
jgi:hypothetical protein